MRARKGAEIKPDANEILPCTLQRFEGKRTASRRRDKPRMVSVRDESLSVVFRVGDADSLRERDTNSALWQHVNLSPDAAENLR